VILGHSRRKDADFLIISINPINVFIILEKSGILFAGILWVHRGDMENLSKALILSPLIVFELGYRRGFGNRFIQ
jgi:hypothetical protein